MTHDLSHEMQARRFAEGFEDALSYFFQLLYAAMVHFAMQITGNREDAEEIVSGAFMKTWRHHYKLDSFGAIRAYLYAVVRRDCYHLGKSRNKGLHVAAADAILEDEIFERIIRTETYRILYEAINGLPEGCRVVMQQYYFEGKTSGEIARDQGLHVSTVKEQKVRGLAKLRKLLGGRKEN